MASFRTHVSFGVATGVAGIIFLGGLVMGGDVGVMAAAFVLSVLGSVLPDLDSDSSLPFHVAFGSFSIVTAALIFSWAHRQIPGDWQAIMLWTFGSALVVWVGVANV